MRFRKCEETFACNRKGVDQQDTDGEYHGGNKNRHKFHHGCLAKEDASCGAMLENSYGDSPPGKDGIEGSSKEPRREEIPHLGRFITSLFRREDACNSGKIDAAESQRQHRGP